MNVDRMMAEELADLKQRRAEAGEQMIEQARRTPRVLVWPVSTMTDPRRDTIARALAEAYDEDVRTAIPTDDDWLHLADAILAALPKLEQVGWLYRGSLWNLSQATGDEPGVVPVYIVREDTVKEQNR